MPDLDPLVSGTAMLPNFYAAAGFSSLCILIGAAVAYLTESSQLSSQEIGRLRAASSLKICDL